MKKTIVLILSILTIFCIQSCLDNISESPLEVPEAIDSPAGITARVGDGSVLLNWRRVPGATAYRIYRSTSTSGTERITETADTSYIDSGVRNETEYYYSVSSVNADGLEGRKSETITAIPTLYSISINGGDIFTGSRAVSIDISVPATTIHMMLDNDSTFLSGNWENARSTRNWNLVGDDGVKRLYAKFRDRMGFESPVVCDSITLDTYSGISEVSFSPHNPSPGDPIHFSITAEGNQTGGDAWIEIEDFNEEIQLYNNGQGGDQVPGDSIYEADYVFPLSFRGTELWVRGNFMDRAGNMASPLEPEGRISFTDPPEPVSYIGVADSTVDRITIRWSESSEENFRYYRIYRSTSPGVEEQPRFLVKQLSNRAQTTYPDGDLMEGQIYHYRIFVINDLNESAGSSELTAHTYDAVPDPVTLDSLSSIGDDRLTLTWSVNQNSDFEKYIIYRSTEPGVTTMSDSIHAITNREITFYDDEGIDTLANIYYYRVYVVDKSGKSSRSDEVSTQQ